MNFMVLQPGQCIYIPADGIHAYLSGDIIECMARSDNVINTGFCPTADRNSVDLFSAVLSFNPHSADEAVVEPQAFKRSAHGKTKLYAPPLAEFNILAVELGQGEREKIEALTGPSVLVVTGGEGKMKAQGKDVEIKEGYVFFVGRGNSLEFEAQSGLQLFIPFAECSDVI